MFKNVYIKFNVTLLDMFEMMMLLLGYTIIICVEMQNAVYSVIILMYFYLSFVNYFKLILRGLNIVLFREYSVNILILWEIPMNIELINILSTHQTDFFHIFFQNLIDLKLTVWKKNNERSVFFLIRKNALSSLTQLTGGWLYGFLTKVWKIHCIIFGRFIR